MTPIATFEPPADAPEAGSAQSQILDIWAIADLLSAALRRADYVRLAPARQAILTAAIYQALAVAEQMKREAGG